ncbi:hypothetical protein HOD41_03345, partial [bacterium]|nr:hypothetical protein [bacterium]
MIKSHFLRYAFVVIALCFPVFCLGSSLDAFVLAIQHFDPDHELGIEYESDEVEFMRQILKQAQESVPAIAGVHVRVDGSLQSEFGPSMFRSLRIKPQGHWAVRSEAEAAGLREIGEFLGRGCRNEEQTNKIYRSNRITSTTKLIRWDIGRDCSEEGDGRLCENVEIIDWLCSIGIGSVTLKEHEYKSKSTVELYLRYQGLVDLEYCAKQLAGDPGFSAILGDFELDPYGGKLIGDGPTMRVVPTDGLDG